MAKKKANPAWMKKWPKKQNVAEERFNRFVKPFEKTLGHMALRIANGKRELAEDYLAKATLKIVSGTGNYQKGRPKQNFAIVIARHSMLNDALAERSYRRTIREYITTSSNRNPGTKNILNKLGRSNEKEIIKVVKMLVDVSDLSQRDKAMFLHHTGLGGNTPKKYRETAAHFGVPTGTAQRVIFNARKKLKEMLSEK